MLKGKRSLPVLCVGSIVTMLRCLFVFFNGQVMSKVMETFQPSAVALQCGSDSLSGDRLGCFNLTIKGKRGSLEGWWW